MRGSIRLRFPPQHGAWAFLLVPLIMAAFLGASTSVGLLFAVTWVLAYPVTYFGSRAVMTRLRRHEWSRIAVRERNDALPWLALFVLAAAPLVLLRPWLILAGLIVGLAWLVSAWLTWIGRERGFANDLVLVLLSAIAAPLMWMAATDSRDVPAGIWLATVVSAVFFVGSVLHVKSLIREADDRRWRVASVAYSVSVAIASPLVSWWLLPAFAAAALRAIAMRPGLRPGAIGAVEAVVSLLVIAGVVLAVRL